MKTYAQRGFRRSLDQKINAVLHIYTIRPCTPSERSQLIAKHGHYDSIEGGNWFHAEVLPEYQDEAIFLSVEQFTTFGDMVRFLFELI